MSPRDPAPPPDPQAAAAAESAVPNRHVVFSHGKESGPWGRKITSLAEVARSEGYVVHSVDYRGLDDPGLRVSRLADYCKDLTGELVLVGSSLGGYVAVASAPLLHARGVFLMAPALYLSGLPPLRQKGLDCPAVVVHGWHDDIVPFEHSIGFAQDSHAALHLLESGHTLHDQLRVIKYLFQYFLIALDLPSLAVE